MTSANRGRQARRGRPDKRRELWLAKDPYLKALQDACHLSTSSAGLSSTDHERQVEDSFFRAAVALEAFLNDWFARSLHFDTTRLAAAARDIVESHARESEKTWRPENQILARMLDSYPARFEVALVVPKAVSAATARRLLGTESSNRSWKSSAEFKEWVGRYLSHEPARRAARHLSATDDALLDATVAIRNVLAHRSPQSEEQLRFALDSSDLATNLRVKTITAAGVGRYLQSDTPKGPRFRVYYEGLVAIANTLAPYVGRRRTICP